MHEELPGLSGRVERVLTLLLVVVLAITAFQFGVLERKVHYS